MRNVTPGARTRSKFWDDPARSRSSGGAPESEAEVRLRRLRGVSWFLDRSIPVGPWRIGIDPIIGLLPGAGDWIGALLSLYVFYEGARLGMPTRVLMRMAGNILVETIVGALPVLGDIFDFVWQANMRNAALIEQHYRPGLPPRSVEQIGWFVVAFTVFVLMLTAGLLFILLKGLWAIFN